MPLREEPAADDLLAIARDVLLNELLPALPPDRAFAARMVANAMAIQRRLLPVHRQLFVEANPIPVKWAMQRLGLCGGALRLPLTELDAANEANVEAALQDAALL